MNASPKKEKTLLQNIEEVPICPGCGRFIRMHAGASLCPLLASSRVRVA
jgi:hypothetical protein